jgi:CheY-like chemotaxis protein
MKGVALSGYGMDEDLQKSRAAGFSDHLVKPINVDALRTVIAGLCNSKASV